MQNLIKLENASDDNQASHRNREMVHKEANIESVRLLTIFPKEIWMRILENIFMPEDFGNLHKSSSLFAVVLCNQKTKTLFSEVIKILCARVDNLPIYKHGAHGKIRKHLLNCRLVCRTWQIGVDNALQSLSTSNKLLNVACHQGLSLSGFSHESYFSSSQQPATFLQQFDGQYSAKNRNPFIGRSLYIFIHEFIPDLESFTQHLVQVLTIYGHHVWNFGLSLAFIRQPLDPSNAWFHERLRDFLQLMPNLKLLKLRHAGWYANNEWNVLRQSLESCVFPELKDLTYLQLEDLPTPVFDALLRRYSHVNMLSSYALMETSDILKYTHNLPNLTQIALWLTDTNELVRWDTSNAMWPLKTLIIRFHCSRVDWQSLFRFLESRWAATLTKLKIGFLCIRSQNYNLTKVLPPLNLPNLKVFAIDSNIRAPLDFILPMRHSLERLVVWYCPIGGIGRQPDDEIEKEIQFYRFSGNLDRSNIWSLFPNLNTVEYSETEAVTRKQLCRRTVSMIGDNKQ